MFTFKNKFVKNNEINNEKQFISEYFINSQYLHTLIFINSFPSLKNAERELLKRFSIYCKQYNIDYLEVQNNGFVINNHVLFKKNIKYFPINNKITVIATHHSCIKNSKHNTLMVNWNPIPYLIPALKNIDTYSCFISANSDTIDNFINSMWYDCKIYNSLNTSLPLSLFKPIELKTQNIKLFYIGSNWHLIGNDNNNSRYNTNILLKKLESYNYINIYGPTRLKNIIPTRKKCRGKTDSWVVSRC